MSDNPSFEIEAPDHFTAGAIGPPGQRVFYLQARDGGRLVTLKVEKGHVRALGEHLGRLLKAVKRPPVRAGREVELLEPVEAVWDVGRLGVGYDEDEDRVLVEAEELLEAPEEEGEERVEAPAKARFRITRSQAAAFVNRADELMKAGRPICPDCGQPKDPDGHVCLRNCPVCSRPMEPEGHVCPRSNGHVTH